MARCVCGMRTRVHTSARSLGMGGLLQACPSVQTVLPLLVGVGMAWCCCGNTTAPPSLHPEALAMLTPTDVEG